MSRIWPVLLLSTALVAASCTGGTSTNKGSAIEQVNLIIWHGDGSGATWNTFTRLIDEWNKMHPDSQVTQTFVPDDYALQRVETAIAGGKYPNIVYMEGPWAAAIAQSPKTVVLNDYIKEDPTFNWNDFWTPERYAATVNGNIIGIPAIVDNLALVYNKKLFDQAGLSYPTAQWTWKDFTDAAIKLTDPAKNQFGWSYTADGSEDTVWRFWPLLWQAGGSVLTPDNKHVAFNSPAGLAALSFLQNLEQHHAIYLDNGSGNYWGLFNSGHIGMLYTGPWDMPGLKVDYGAQILAGDQNHATVTGPDNWVLLDHGSAADEAAFKFIAWYTEGAQDMQTAIVNATLPLRMSETKLPEYQQLLGKYPLMPTFVANEANARARPVTPFYPQISELMGKAIVSVLLGRSTPAAALTQAAQQADAALAGGG